MANGQFNIAKGRSIELYNRVKNNDPANAALIIALLKANEAEDALVDHATLADLLAAAGNTEADFTGSIYAQLVLTDAELAVAPAPDNVANHRDIFLPQMVWPTAGGTVTNALTKLLVCYKPDTTVAGDATVEPLYHLDFAITTDGNDLIANPNVAGIFRAT